MDKLLFFTNCNKSPPNSCDEFLKSLSERLLTNLFRLEFINSMLPIKTKLLLIVKSMYFSNEFGTTFYFTSNLFIPCMNK